MKNTNEVIKCSGLSIGYAEKVVSSNLQLTAIRGNMICVLGKNGCGKSTLIRTLSGLQMALGGQVCISTNEGERNVAKMSATEKANYMALVLTERLSISSTTVHDVVAMGRYPYTSFLGRLTDDDEQIVANALEQVGMGSMTSRFYNNLSDGEKQRVLIAKALAQQTSLILLDEPTAHLDLPNRIKTLMLLRHIAHTEQKTIIISTHELDLALQLADEIWLMYNNDYNDSEIIVGSPNDLIKNGAFERAFNDSSFSFINDNQQLRIKINDKD